MAKFLTLAHKPYRPLLANAGSTSTAAAEITATFSGLPSLRQLSFTVASSIQLPSRLASFRHTLQRFSLIRLLPSDQKPPDQTPVAMPRYYCDYCDTYLTHDSPSVRKQHNAGYKHKANVRAYYQQFEEQQTQSLIDQRIKEHLGQAASFQHQIGASFNQHLMAMPGNRPPLPVLLPPILPMGASSQAPMSAPIIPGVRPPILPPPLGAPGYGAVLPMPGGPPTVVPPGAAASAPMQLNNLPRPPTLAPPISGAMPTPATNNPVMYQGNPSSATTASFDSFNGPAAGSV